METKPPCRGTHRQILRGVCPWCDAMIADGRIIMDPRDSKAATDFVWNIEVLEADLRSSDREIRFSTITNIWRDSPPVEAAIRLMGIALNDTDDDIAGYACGALERLGSEISNVQAAEFESRIATGENELALRWLLVGYYFIGQRQSPTGVPARRRHVLWLIENAFEMKATGKPGCLVIRREDPDGYNQAKSLWLKNVDANSQNPTVLANAASFFTLSDPALSEQLLRQGQTLEPDKPYWCDQLGQLYSLQSRRRNGPDDSAAAQSFAAHEQAEKLRAKRSSDDEPELERLKTMMLRLHSLPDLAKSAFAAKEFEAAANYASELLSLANSTELPEFFRNDGNAIHHGNLVLGRVALAMGDVEQAGKRLLAAGRTTGSPQLDSFGPNMSLAKELVECGEQQVVLEYFDLCQEFWKHGDERLKCWAAVVEDGRVPEFGANLAY